MNNSIEINGRTILYLVSSFVSISLLIFTINKYDNAKKIKKLEHTLNQLEGFTTPEFKSKFLNINTDSLTDSETEDIRSYFSAIDNDNDFKNIYRHGMQILIEEDAEYYIIQRRYNYSSNLARNQIQRKTLSKQEKEMINAINESGVDVNIFIMDENLFRDSKKIIYPIASNESKNVYLYFTYYESQ